MIYSDTESTIKYMERERISKLKGIHKQYAEYEYNYKYKGGYDSDEELLSYDEWIDRNYDC